MAHGKSIQVTKESVIITINGKENSNVIIAIILLILLVVSGKFPYTSNAKVGCVFPMVISSEFRMRQHRDDDHREDAPHFATVPCSNLKTDKII